MDPQHRLLLESAAQLLLPHTSSASLGHGIHMKGTAGAVCSVCACKGTAGAVRTVCACCVLHAHMFTHASCHLHAALICTSYLWSRAVSWMDP